MGFGRLGDMPMYTQVNIPFFCLSLLAGPLLAGWFTERKGVFHGCILLILLSQSPLLLLLQTQETTVLLVVQTLLLIAASGFPVILAVLTHYLYGPVNYPQSFGTLLFCIPTGLILVFPFLRPEESSRIPLEEPAVCLFCLFPLSFFCIFFAWKQRFVILKNQGI